MYGDTAFTRELLASVWPEWKVASRLGKGSYGSVYEIYRDDLGTRYTSALKILYMESSDAESIDYMNDSSGTFRDPSGSGSGLSSDSGSGSGSGSGGSSGNPFLRYASDSMIDDFIVNVSAEIKTMIELKGHPNIVSIEDYAVRRTKSSCAILIRMEKLEALTAYIKRTGSMSRDEVIRLGISICKALSLCEKKNIIHRDIKLNNLFFSEKTGYKLGDFGISRTMDSIYERASMSGTGTPQYMAPEVYMGDRYNNTADLYSLGIVLYILMNNMMPPLCSDYPDSADRISIIHQANIRRLQGETLPGPSQADDRLAGVILTACSPKPEKRYPTADTFSTALSQCLSASSAAFAGGSSLAGGDSGSQNPEQTRRTPVKEAGFVSDPSSQSSAGTNRESRIIRIFPETPDESGDSENRDSRNAAEYSPNAGGQTVVDYNASFREQSGQVYSQGYSSDSRGSSTPYSSDSRGSSTPYSGDPRRSSVPYSGDPRRPSASSSYSSDPHRPSASSASYGAGPRRPSASHGGSVNRSSASSDYYRDKKGGSLPLIPIIVLISAAVAVIVLVGIGYLFNNGSAGQTVTGPTAGSNSGISAQNEDPIPGGSAPTQVSDSGNTVQTDTPDSGVTAQTDGPDSDVITQTDGPDSDVITQTDEPDSDVTAQTDEPDSGAAAQTDEPDSDVTAPPENQTPATPSLTDPIEWSDGNLRKAVYSYLNIDGTMTYKDAASVKRLVLEDAGIINIDSLRYFTRLEELRLKNNSIEDLSPLSGLTGLKQIHLEENKISDLTPLAEMTWIEKLDLYDNNISDISALEGMKSLTMLDLRYNMISDVSVLRDKTNMNDLYLGTNQISDISAIAGMTRLTYLNISYNYVEDISVVANMPDLAVLTMTSNRIRDITPIRNCPKLYHLKMKENLITDFSVLDEMSIDYVEHD